MLQRLWNSLRRNPGRFALGLSLVLGPTNAAFLAIALFSRENAAILATEVEALRESLAQLRQVERDGLEGLEQSALTAESRLEEVKASFPVLGDPFDLYRQGFALAIESGVDIKSITTGNSTVQETPVGLLSKTTFLVSASGDFPNCLDLMDRLETAGLQTLALEGLFIGPGDKACDFQVVIASAVPAAAVQEPTE